MIIKVIRIKMPDGDYDVPLEFVARHRANYYANLDASRGEGTYEENFKNEVEYVMNDDYEGIDWLENNMDWSDVSGVAVKLSSPPKADIEEAFCNAEKTILLSDVDE